MNDLNRNTRTLILSFVVAVMALIPLRFVEVSQQLGNEPGVQVLGTVSQQQIVLPNAAVSQNPVLEAPYYEIENQQLTGQVAGTSCMAAADAEVLLKQLQAKAVNGQLQRPGLDEVINEMVAVENNICR